MRAACRSRRHVRVTAGRLHRDDGRRVSLMGHPDPMKEGYMQENTNAASPRLVAVMVAAVVAAVIAAFAWAGGPDVAGAASTAGSGGTSQTQSIQSEQATPDPGSADR